MSIKKIEAVIRPEMLEPLRVQLEETGYPGIMVSEIEGHGKQRGVEQQFRGNKYKTYFLPKIKLELVVKAGDVKGIVDTIVDVCGSGKVGDGKIFISTIDEVVRIRTKEKGAEAI